MGNTVKKILTLFSGALLFISMLIFNEYSSKYAGIMPVSTELLESHGIENADKLMIAAHPDDEVIWGGGHLMDKGYFVVIITNGRNPVRRNEFESVIEKSGNNGIILDYPDKSFGVRSNWKTVLDDIGSDLEKIIDYKSWNLIVTHNEKGEYGHIHHKMTHETVAGIFDRSQKKTGTKLCFFGKYYKKSDIEKCENSTLKMSAKRIEFKEKLLNLYKSQKSTIKKLSHMNSYEDWTEKNNGA